MVRILDFKSPLGLSDHLDKTRILVIHLVAGIFPLVRDQQEVLFGARGIGTNGASARVFEGKEKIRINMAARLLSRVAFHLPLSFLSPTSVHQKTPKNVFKNTLLSSSPDMVKLQYLSRRQQKGKTVVIVREGSRRVVTVCFL